MKLKTLILFILLSAHLAAQVPADSLTRVRPDLTYSEELHLRLDSLMADTLLETTQVGLMVWDLTTDSLLYARGERQLLRVASTMKLLTAIAALDRLGASHRLSTSLYYKGDIVQGQLRGDIICRGGMDPMFSRADMRAMAKALHDAGVTSVRGRLIADVSMKESEKWGAGWCWDDENPTLSALLVDGKAAFTSTLLHELRTAGVSTSVSIVTSTLPAGATLVCTRWHTLGDVLLQMMKESDNLYAEAVLYQIAAANVTRTATAKDAQKTERDVMRKAGLQPMRYRLADGSGLSLYNYLSAECLTMLLRYAWHKPDIYRALLESLPIAAEDGTLKNRMADTPAAHNVQAKTGTVTGVSSLAGYLTAPNGHRLAFAVINQGVQRASDGRRFQDSLCLTLCSTPMMMPTAVPADSCSADSTATAR